jgi:hypothetical protein
METSVGDTVNIVDPFTPLRLAWIVVDPDPTLVAKPFDPAVLLIVATFVAVELHVTEVVMVAELPSE